MKKLLMTAASLLMIGTGVATGARYNSEKTISVNGAARKYVLYVPDKAVENAPLVFSLHGAAGHDTDRSPMRTSVADSEGFIVVYPQGVDQYFPVFGGNIPGWNSTGEANEDLDFFKAVIDEVAGSFSIDRDRVYCCGFSNGGMMTYSNASAASDIFAAFASISGFQLNEFHLRATGARPVPFMHIHGKADDFVKYSCMPVIRDMMVARNGCYPVPEVTTVNGKYRRSVYEARDGGFPYVYYEIDGMGHNDYTDKTPDNNSAMAMWRFMSQYTLRDACDPTLKWRLNVDTPDFDPKAHNWRVNAAGTRYEYGRAKKAGNVDNNVYPALQLEAGHYALTFDSEGADGHNIYVQIEPLDGGDILMCKAGEVGKSVTMPLSVTAYTQYKLTIVKDDAGDLLTSFAIHSCEAPAADTNCRDTILPTEVVAPEQGHLEEIPQDQGRQYDDFARASMSKMDGYTEYTASGDLQIAFKMMDVDVKDCDYVLIKFAEPVAPGWKLAFWSGTDLTDLPAGAEEYTFELEPSMLATGRLPQICMMTFFGGYTAPLKAKVAGVYKHCTLDHTEGIAPVALTGATPVTYVSPSGVATRTPTPGLNLVQMSDGTVNKHILRH